MAGRLEETLARRLRELARTKHVALSHVADRAGVSRSYFWLLLDGENSATLAVVQRIAEALEVEPLSLLADDVADERQSLVAERPEKPRERKPASDSKAVPRGRTTKRR